MTNITSVQKAIEWSGLLLILTGSIGLFNLAIPIPFFSSQAKAPLFLTLLSVGSFLSGFRTIPRLTRMYLRRT